MQGSRLLAFTDNSNLVIFKIEIDRVKRMDLTDPQAELIHQSINGVIANAQDRIGIDGFNQKTDLLRC